MEAPDEMHPLVRLLGGAWPRDSELGTIIDHLATTLNGLVGQSAQLDFKQTSDRRVSILGPYLARGVLEVAFSILVARLDPFRVLVLRQIQRSPDFDIQSRNSCALQWKGDFLDDKVDDLWKASRKPREMSRALLADYQDHVFWRPAFEALLDKAPDGRGGSWLAELRLIAPDTFTARMRTRAERVYSACSKGVHHEFVIPQSAYYDPAQVLELLTEVLQICSVLAIVINSPGHVPYCLSIDEALSCFERLQEL